ncbi:glycosyltransferase [Chondrinema litorale]|uniref:glycosyltransferase n=1 Tax=Chondrinema litorale TaxID=2994555 RepID=UPI0025428B53|nr:glycosyltransferase [Chondrinema litorale]UZS00105.1 glycosyltransferase [Chondrinema litorale]
MAGKNIIYIGLGTWDGSTSKNSVRLMSILGDNNKVLFVNYQYTLKDVILALFKMNSFSVPLLKILGLNKRIEEKNTLSGNKVNVLTLYPLLSINFISQKKLFLLALKINNWILRTCVKKYMKKLSFDTSDTTIVYGFNPFMGIYNIGEFNEKRNIYYCYDQIKAAKWASKHGEEVENMFIKKVDTVITTSRALYEEKSHLNKNCILIQNGVDFELFNKAYSEDCINTNKSNPVIGYVGVIDDRIDFNLIKFLAENLTNYSFKFVGKVTEKGACEKIIQSQKNIEFLGEIKYEEVMVFLKEFDLCIIPFVKNEFTRNIYPIKINEYLAAGKPVVSTDFANLQEFVQIVSICQSKNEFLDSIQQEFILNNHDKITKRIELAKQNSWGNRANAFSKLIR